MALGDRDLSFDEIKRMSRKLFDDQGTLYFDQASKEFCVGVFLDGLGQRPIGTTGHPILPTKRPEKIYGRGKTWQEAFDRAVRKLAEPAEGSTLVS